jgi:hypothetical protein
LSRGIRRRALALAIVASVLAGAGCGSATSDGPSTGNSVNGPGPPSVLEPQRLSGPRGKLTGPEYKHLRTALGLLASAGGRAPAAGIRALARGCRLLHRPRTELVEAVHRECDRTRELVRVLLSFRTRNAGCARDASHGDVSCFTGLFEAASNGARRLLAAKTRTNAALRRRHIRGGCARVLGTPQSRRTALLKIGRASRAARRALHAKDVSALNAAAKRVDAGIAATARVGGDSVALLRSCPRA